MKVRVLKKEEFFKQIDSCQVPESFDQDLLDRAAAMFEKWGLPAHSTWAETGEEHLLETHGLNDKSGDSEAVKKEKKALRCVASKMMKMQIRKEDAVGIMKNFNSINKPGFRWLE
jgi:hypothetical protein